MYSSLRRRWSARSGSICCYWSPLCLDGASGVGVGDVGWISMLISIHSLNNQTCYNSRLFYEMNLHSELESILYHYYQYQLTLCLKAWGVTLFFKLLNLCQLGAWRQCLTKIIGPLVPHLGSRIQTRKSWRRNSSFLYAHFSVPKRHLLVLLRCGSTIVFTSADK